MQDERTWEAPRGSPRYPGYGLHAGDSWPAELLAGSRLASGAGTNVGRSSELGQHCENPSEASSVWGINQLSKSYAIAGVSTTARGVGHMTVWTQHP